MEQTSLNLLKSNLSPDIADILNRIIGKTKKCAYCGRELFQSEIKDYYEGNPHCQQMVLDDLISAEEMCPYCGYHNDNIEEESLEMYYSIIT